MTEQSDRQDQLKKEAAAQARAEEEAAAREEAQQPPERPADYNGDAGDQGNDLRFREEERLIREQSGHADDAGR